MYSVRIFLRWSGKAGWTMRHWGPQSLRSVICDLHDEGDRPDGLGWGVVESLGGFACGPVALIHTCKVGIKYKKPLGLKLI